MAETYQYARQDGSMGTISANSSDEALGFARTAKDAAKGTGVMKVPMPSPAPTPIVSTPVTPTTPVVSPTESTPSPYVPTSTSPTNPTINRPIYDNEPALLTAKTEEEIQAEKARQAQAEIDNLNKYYDTIRNETRIVNEGNTRGTNAISTLTGLAGSTEANIENEKTTTKNTQALAKVEQERNAAIGAILSGIRTSAVEEAKQSRLEARQSEQDRIAYREKAQANAVATLTQLSASESGATLDGLKKTLSPEEYDTLIKNAGGEALAKAILFENRPKNSIMGNPTLIGGKMVQAYTTPSGKVIYENVDLPEGVDVNKIRSIEKTDNGIFIINEDGTYSKITGSGKIASSSSAGVGSGSSSGTGVSSTATGSVARDAESVMAGVLNLQDISTAKNYRASVSAELKRKSDEALASGDIYGTMKASAAYDKEPSDTFLQSMEKTQVVLEQIGTLQANIEGVRTGPIEGAFKSKNPWDTKAQTIKAQLNAIVPNLARGVYGEVGVLTDNDIKTYAKTLPNLTSTEAVRNAILYITVDMIRKNIEVKIRNQAAGQRDMSGYADTYKRVQAKATEILATIPGASATQADTGMVPMIGPDGKKYSVPKDKADAFIKAGGRQL